MNVDWGDFDNDGLLDIYVTNITDDYMREGNFLWKNNGNLTFTDVSRETGTYDTGWGWGAKFFDYDNDGWLDLYVTNGWVSAGKRELRAGHLRDDHQAGHRSRRRPQLAADGQQEPERVPEEAAVPQRARPGVHRSGARGTAWIRPATAGASRSPISTTTAGWTCSWPTPTASRILYHNVMPAAGHWAEFVLAGTSRTAAPSARRCA